MTYPISPQQSPPMAGGSKASHDTPLGGPLPAPTPQLPASQSKRDKRRNALSEKLNELSASFSQNRDVHYRQQLQALQIDMALIMRADPYAASPLDDSGEDVAELVAASTGGNGVGGGQQGPAGQRRAEGEVAALAGRWYAQFVDEVNDAAEERDAGLTMLETSYKRALHELHATNRYKIRLAEEEHAQLARTLRDRLMQGISQKKVRLMREKEQLDIADSNALLLHPSQFSITNPASPGNGPHNRKTRHSRQRPGEMDEVGAGYGGGEAGHKRKRKAGGELDELEAAVVNGGRGFDLGSGAGAGAGSSPFRDGRARGTGGPAETAALYTIERLFTEKELSVHLNQAHVAAFEYFARLRSQARARDGSPAAAGERTEDEGGPAAAAAAAAAVHEGTPAALAEASEATPTLAPVEMERGANQSHHATRSRNGMASALGTSGEVAGSDRNGSHTTAAALFLSSSVLNKNGTVPGPSMLRPEEIEDDMAKLERIRRAPGSSTDTKLLKELCEALAHPGFPVGPLLADLRDGRSSRFDGAAAASSTGPAGQVGGVAMSTQSSMAGFSDMGGVAMSRHDGGSSMGAPMRRSASAAGGGGASRAGDVKRGRNHR